MGNDSEYGKENVIRLEEGIIEVWKHKERRYWQAFGTGSFHTKTPSTSNYSGEDAIGKLVMRVAGSYEPV